MIGNKMFLQVFGVVLSMMASPLYAKQKPSLVDSKGWTSDTIRAGLVYHNYNGYDEVTKACQNVNVLELSPKCDMALKFVYFAQGDSLSGVINREKNNGVKVVAGMNAAYEPEAIYIRVAGENFSEVEPNPDHLRFWKHEGAVTLNKKGKWGFMFPSREDGVRCIREYKKSTATDIFASAAMLVYNYDPVGLTFVSPEHQTWTIEQLNTLDYEDKERHQGVRHPRTIIAETANHHILLVTIDGRRDTSAGMSVFEATQFLNKYFHPRHALNMDGGGSTTMCIDGLGQKGTSVVNYPCDNKRFDHWGQRMVTTHFLIVEK